MGALVRGGVGCDLMTRGGLIPKRLDTSFSCAKIASSVVAGSTSDLSLSISSFKYQQLLLNSATREGSNSIVVLHQHEFNGPTPANPQT